VNRILKKVLIGVGATLGLVVVGGAAYAGVQISRFNSSMETVYDVPLPKVTRSTDPAVIERGKHLAQTLAPCVEADCHGGDLGGGKTIDAGPLGRMTGPNVSAGGLGAAYSDGELFRLIRHGVRKDGRSVRFMPAHEMGWLPDEDINAIISYLRTVPPVQKPNGPFEIGPLAKVLDRHDMFVVDVARRIDHQKPELAPPPSPTAQYGGFIAKGCTGCHGAKLSGGPIPGAPAHFPVPLNLTPDDTGLKGWTFEEFDKTITTGIRKNGKKLDPFMPITALSKLDELEKKALFAYLSSLPPRAFGGR
jgi:hypothetical protein